ncbi:winged helix-turn-helix transcriptional regulator [Candidatus Kaiserbacteria bacterium]|nr:winged helix-turn-helix transcriptional regulator [Candidatus Kaiserbacteria bacterium]
MINSNAKKLDRVFASLANNRRRQIVYTLGFRPASIGQLAKQQRLSLPAIHRHIKVLEEAKLVQRKKSGRVNFLALDRTGLLLMQDWVLQYQAYWGTDEETLENYIASIESQSKKLTKLKKKK